MPRSASPPYIGVAGVSSKEQIEALATEIENCPGLRLSPGLLINKSTLEGLPSPINPSRYPARELWSGIFPANPKCINLVHFNSRSRASDLVTEIRRVQNKVGPYCHGFQLNMPWPGISELKMMRKDNSDLIIALQCGRAAIQDVSAEPSALAERVGDYGDVIDYVVIDPSGGTGKQIDPLFAQQCLEHLTDRAPGVTPIIAGGLCAKTLQWSAAPLVVAGHRFGVDAESSLRDANDEFYLPLAQDYVRAAIETMQQRAVA